MGGMYDHSNDLFWLSLAANADIVDDPEGLSHPICQKAARIGVSPDRLYKFCRHAQKIRADAALKRSQAGAESYDAGLQNLQPLNESIIVVTQDGLQQSIDIDKLNAKLAGVES